MSGTRYFFCFTPSVKAIFTLIGVASVALILIAMIVIGPDRDTTKT